MMIYILMTILLVLPIKIITGPGVIRPEVLVVVDSSLSQRIGDNDQQVKTYIRDFFSKVARKFDSLSSPLVSLHLSDIVLSSPPYLASSVLNTSSSSVTSLYAAQALDMMGKHYYPPTVDLVITLLYLDLCNHGGDFCDIVGKTYTGGACLVDHRVKKAKGVALIEDDGDYSGVMVAVHELAHLLGAVHDGYYGAAECSKEGFIMSERARGDTWSQCSRNSIRQFITARAASCLHNCPNNTQCAI